MDPKDRIEVFESYHSVATDIGRGNFSSLLLERIQDIRSRAPETRGLTFLEATVQEGLGNLDAAALKYKKALQEDPENNQARALGAKVLLRLGKLEEAEKALLEVLSREPEDYRSRNNLAGIYQMTGRRQAAIAEMQMITQTRPGYSAGWQNLGRLHSQMKDWVAAEVAFRKVVELDQSDGRAHLHLSQVLRALGRIAESEREREIAIRLDPGLSKQ